MKKVSYTLAVIVITMLSIIPLTSQARGIFGNGDRQVGSEQHQQRRLKRLIGFLDLTDEQRESVQTLYETFREQSQPIKDVMQQNRDTLRSLTQAVPVDTNTIQQVADSQGELFAQLIVLKTEKRIALRSILTDEQLEKLEELHEVVTRFRPGKPDTENDTEF
ncbi:MAG: Spy/CpxP family protein refolding chaperone [Gammaproteobacteria bacterium]|nr:Spy/CpxP family protein refolding chaperone [Gammaproteobacteria bacterium]